MADEGGAGMVGGGGAGAGGGNVAGAPSEDEVVVVVVVELLPGAGDSDALARSTLQVLLVFLIILCKYDSISTFNRAY